MNRAQLLASLLHECDVAKHLHRQLPPGALDFRPTPKQRSTLDLLRYLTYCAIGPARAALAGTFEAMKPLVEAARTMPPSEFPAAMDRQAAALRDLVGSLSDDDYRSRPVTLPPVATGALGEVLVNTSLKFLTAYRMQLFLYAKMAGVETLDTWDCWRGQTNPHKMPTQNLRV